MHGWPKEAAPFEQLWSQSSRYLITIWAFPSPPLWLKIWKTVLGEKRKIKKGSRGIFFSLRLLSNLISFEYVCLVKQQNLLKKVTQDGGGGKKWSCRKFASRDFLTCLSSARDGAMLVSRALGLTSLPPHLNGSQSSSFLQSKSNQNSQQAPFCTLPPYT